MAAGSQETWAEKLTVVVDSVDGQWLRPFFVPDTLNLAADGVRQRVPVGKHGNLATSDNRCSGNAAKVERIRPVFDGDPGTAAFFQASATEDPSDRLLLFVQNLIVDLGADYPVRRLRFYPRLGRENPSLEHILASMSPPRLVATALPEQDFSRNHLRWYELAGAAAGAGFPDECVGAGPVGRDPEWFLSIPPMQREAENDRRLEVLARSVESEQIVVEVEFPARPLRWLALRPLYPVRNWEVAEFEVYGEGHVRQAEFRTAVLDFGQPMVFGRLQWSGSRPDSADVEIRTRTGSDADPTVYWRRNPRGEELEEVVREEYEKTPVRQRATSDDLAAWSAWTPPYVWSGDTGDRPILSPSPTRYLQMQILFRSRGPHAGRLRNLRVELSEPVAHRAVAEIWPRQVERGETVRFTYLVRPTLFDGDGGFDRLEIFTLTQAARVEAVRVDGVDWTAAFPPQVHEDRIVAAFPAIRGGGDTDKIVEVVFDAQVVLFGTEFRGWIYDSAGTRVRQLVEAGDASLDYPANTLSVVTLPLGKGHLDDVQVDPPVFTPNGDRVNEVARFRFKVFDMTRPGRLRVTVYSLTGGHVRTVWDEHVVRGIYGDGDGLTWDGRDGSGRLVPPGAYLYRVRLDGDEGVEQRTGIVRVAY